MDLFSSVLAWLRRFGPDPALERRERHPAPPRDGDICRFRRYPDDGEAFLVRGDGLVNLTTPGGDLLLSGGRILSLEGRFVAGLGELEPLVEG